MEIYLCYIAILGMLSIIDRGINGNSREANICLKQKKQCQKQICFYKIKKNNNICLIIAFYLYFLIFALRKETVGTDIVTYRGMLAEIAKTPWIDIFTKNNLQFGPDREIGYVILSKIVVSVTTSYQAYLAAFAAIETVLFYKFTKENSIMPYLTVFLFITLSFINFNLSALRQGMALSITLYSFKYVFNKKYIRFILLTFVATLFHKSAIIFIIMPFLYLIDFKYNTTKVMYFIIYILFFIFRKEILTKIGEIAFGGYEVYDTGAINLMIIMLGITIVGMVIYRFFEKQVNGKIVFNTIAFSTGLMILNTISMVAERANLYFYILIIIYIPMFINCFKEKIEKRWFVSIIIIALCIYYFLLKNVDYLNITPYKFFW